MHATKAVFPDPFLCDVERSLGVTGKVSFSLHSTFMFTSFGSQARFLIERTKVKNIYEYIFICALGF
uniref:Uncharacterized protein n=1 Tax=Kalanchoe fedtschenkoi TaxID=63787 RepID=A0A7N0UN68_KALFE